MSAVLSLGLAVGYRTLLQWLKLGSKISALLILPEGNGLTMGESPGQAYVFF